MPDYRRARDGAMYFFTVVTHQRRPFLCTDESRAALKGVMSEIRQAYPFGVRAFVLLPDHLHCLWELPEGDNDYSLRWGLIKKEFTKRTKGRLNVAKPSASRLAHRESAVWQRRFWEHRIRDDEDFRAHVDYIHYNPVRHGLAGSPGEWEHSTFHAYVKAGIYPAHWGCEPPSFPERMGGE